MTTPALFLDRDGVINVDHNYVHRREDVDFGDGIFELVAAAKAAGYMVIVITNQAGIGRGYYTEDDFLQLMAWMKGRFQEHSGDLDAVYFCPYHPDGQGEYRGESAFRKPAPGMILQAAAELDIDLAESLLVGDKISDIQAGIAAGIPKRFLLGIACQTDDAYQINTLLQVLPHLDSRRDNAPDWHKTLRWRSQPTQPNPKSADGAR